MHAFVSVRACECACLCECVCPSVCSFVSLFGFLPDTEALARILWLYFQFSQPSGVTGSADVRCCGWRKKAVVCLLLGRSLAQRWFSWWAFLCCRAWRIQGRGGFGFRGGRGKTWDWPLPGKHPALYQTPSDLGPFLHFPLEFDLWFQVNFKSQGHVVTTFLEGVQFLWEADVRGRAWRVVGQGLCTCLCCSCCGCWWWRW